MSDDDSSSCSSVSTFDPDPVIHVNMRVIARKNGPKKSSGHGPPNIDPSFLLHSTGLARPTTAPESTVAPPRGLGPQNYNSGASFRSGGTRARERPSERRRSSKKNKEKKSVNIFSSSSSSSKRKKVKGSVTPPPASPQSPDFPDFEHPTLRGEPLPIPLNNRDKAALKLGRSLIHEISHKYDKPNEDNTLQHSRYFVDRWLASFDSDSKSVDAFGMEMLARMSSAEFAQDQLGTTPAKDFLLGDRTDPKKPMVSLACQVFDAMVDKCGREFPVLQCLRKALYPSIFMEDCNPGPPVASSLSSLSNVGEDNATFGEAKEEHRRTSDPPGSLPYHDRRMWFESDAETKLSEALQKIELLEAEKEEIRQKYNYANAELENAKQCESELAEKLSVLDEVLEAKQKECDVHNEHKASLRNMLDEEKNSHRDTKDKSENLLREAEATHRKNAMARVFKLQVSQKKALGQLKETEEKYMKARLKIDEMDKVISEHEKRNDSLKKEMEERLENFQSSLTTASSERDRAVDELDNYKEMSQSARLVYGALQEEHNKLVSAHKSLKEEYEASDRQALVNQYESLMVEQQEEHAATLEGKDAEIERLDGLVNANGTEINDLKTQLTEARDKIEASVRMEADAENLKKDRDEANRKEAEELEQRKKALHDERKNFVDKSAVEKLEKEIKRLKESIAGNAAKHDAECETLREKLDRAREQMQFEIDRLTEELRTAQQNEAFYSEKFSETDAIDALRDAELKSAKSDLEKHLLDEISYKEKHIAIVQQKLDELLEENTRLKERLESERGRIFEQSNPGKSWKEKACEEDDLAKANEEARLKKIEDDEKLESEIRNAVGDIADQLILQLENDEEIILAEQMSREKEEEERLKLKQQQQQQQQQQRDLMGEALQMEAPPPLAPSPVTIAELSGTQLAAAAEASEEVKRDNDTLRAKITELEEELRDTNMMYESAAKRSSDAANEIGELKRRIADLEEICGKLEDTLKRTSSKAVGSGVTDMIAQLENRNKFKKKAKKILTAVKMGGGGGFGSKKKGGGIAAAFGAKKPPEGQPLKSTADDENEKQKDDNEKSSQVKNEEQKETEQLPSASPISETENSTVDAARLEQKIRSELEVTLRAEVEERLRVEMEEELRKKKQQLHEEASTHRAALEKKHADELEAEGAKRSAELELERKKELEALAQKERAAAGDVASMIEKMKMTEKRAAEAEETEKKNRSAALASKLLLAGKEIHAEKKVKHMEEMLTQAQDEIERARREAEADRGMLIQKLEEVLAQNQDEIKRVKMEAQMEAEVKMKEMTAQNRDEIERIKADAEVDKRRSEHTMEEIVAQNKEEIERVKADAKAERDDLLQEVERTKRVIAEEMNEKKRASEEEARNKERQAIKQKADNMDNYGKGLEASQKAAMIKDLLNQQRDLKVFADAGNKMASKKVHDFEKKICKLRSDLENYGGWKNALILSGGSVDLEFDLEPWPQKQQVEILKMKKEWLIKVMKEEKDAAGKAFREVDLKNLELDGDLRRR